jgi:excisionase family DNA binding protein
MPGSGPLLRPSALARFWELHPKTVVQWIREGRLPAIRSPGGQWRVRPSDLAEHCAAHGLPLPPAGRARAPRLYVLGAKPPTVRAVKRALEGLDVVVEAFPEPLDGLLAAVRSPPSALALDVGARTLDADAAIRALRKAGASFAIVAFGASTATRASAYLRAGATRAIPKGRDAAPLAAALVAVLT